MRAAPLACVIVSAAVLGCGPNPRTGAVDRDPGARSSQTLSAPEIAEGRYATVRQAIVHLRPHFLHARGAGPHGAPIQVYLDGVRLGDARALATLPTSGIARIRYLTASEATLRFGAGNSAGAIAIDLVDLRPGRR